LLCKYNDFNLAFLAKILIVEKFLNNDFFLPLCGFENQMLNAIKK
jgi:hypothetical protein